ncbi:MAG: ABC transporter ATP-binding protein [Saprospiraceae bacterium]|nr:ABC transporter ATP-binding protein [Saprospiraceae bacterium]MBK7738125.1 ABC transporter ATP-binding protein [Saprospiraceae bacterium]MBK7913295.1 ABC transporter ATP-binding protein [Saprospiraceae bacterium]
MTGFNTLKRLLVFVKPYRLLFWVSALIAIIMAPLNAYLPYLANVMVDDHIMVRDLEGLKRISLWYLGALASLTFLRYSFTILTNTMGQNIIYDLRNKMYDHILSLRLSYFDKTPIGTNTTRVINDLETVNSVFSEGLITIIADILSLITVLALMFWTSVKLTLICLVTFPLLLVASYIFKEKVKHSFQRVRAQVARMNAFLQEHISGIKTVQIFAAEKRVAKKFKEINREYTQANLDGIFYYAVFFPVVEIISAASLGFMVWWGAQGVLEGVVTIGQLVAFPMYLSRLFQPVRTLADKFNTLQMGLVAGGRVFETLDTKEQTQDQGTIDQGDLKAALEFKQVCFGYRPDEYILKNISFRLEPGKTLALVGSTGSGKSSLISLINRLYEINQGSIQIGNHSISDYKIDFLRKRIAVVLQDVFLFQGSIYENMSLKNPEIYLEQVIAASKIIGAHEYIMNLPGNYNYQLAERGVNLSVGQRQLISFVRALLVDPDILILDEATSSLDTETESILQHAIEKLIAKRSSIVIAHRLSTIQHADYVMALEHGEIKEFGPPAELLARDNGLYKKLYETYFQTVTASVND